MSLSPAARIYLTDWVSDPQLALCSMGAQGFLLRLLCISHAANEGGWVSSNGHAIPPDRIAFLTRCSLEDVAQWLAELKANGVVQEDDRGRLSSPRLVRTRPEHGICVRQEPARCPADWEPDQTVTATAREAGLNEAEITREIATFRDHEFSASKSDWQAAARNWVRRAGANKKPEPKRVTWV